MDFTFFTTEDVLDFINTRYVQLTERKKTSKGQLRRATLTRLSELSHLRHSILIRSQEAKRAQQ